MEIVTGYVGQNHIESDDVQSLLRGIMGDGTCLLDTASNLAPTLTDANTVTIAAGDILFQGVHCRVPYGTVDTVSISNGSSDYDRTDVIALRYEKDSATGVESVSWAYYEGGSDGEAPSVTEGSIEEGDLVAEVVVFQITFDAMTPYVTNVFGLTNALPTINGIAMAAQVNMLRKANITDVFYQAGSTATLYFQPVAGEMYSNKKTLFFFVPFAKPLLGVSGVTITSGTYQVKANNAIIVSSRSLTSETKTVTLYPNGIKIQITRSSGFSGSGNAVCSVSGQMTVRFS